MNTTTIPKKRDHNKWNASEKKRQELESTYTQKKKFTFEQYCEYSLCYLDAPDTQFYKDGKCELKPLLINPTIDYSNSR